MAEDRIDSVIDRAAIEAEIRFATKELHDLSDLIREVKAQSIKVSAAGNTAEFNKLKQDLDVLKRQTELQTKATIADAKASEINARAKVQEAKAATELAKAEAISEKQKVAHTKATDAQAKSEAKRAADLEKQKIREQKLNDELLNDYRQLSLAYNSAALRAKNLSLQLGANHPVTVAAIKDANEMGNKLKQLDYSVGVFNRNVGNYSSALIGYGQKAFSFIKTAANIIPGLGISGAILLLIEPFKALVNAIRGVADAAEISKQNLDRLVRSLDEAKKSVDAVTESVEFLNKIGRINLDISGIKDADLLDLQAQMVGLQNIFYELSVERDRIRQQNDKLQLDIRQGEINKKDAAKAQEEIDKRAEENLNARVKNEDTRRILARQIELQKKKDREKAAKDQEEIDKKAAADRKKRAEEALRLEERNLKAEFEINMTRLRTVSEIAKQSADDENQFYEVRLNGLRAYEAAKVMIIRMEAEYEKSKRGLTAKEILAIEAKAQDQLLRLSREVSAIETEIIEKKVTKVVGLYRDLRDKYKDVQKEMSEDEKKRQEESLRREEELAREKFRLQQELATEISNLAFTVMTADLERQKNLLQDQIDLIEERKTREIEAVDRSTASAQEKAAQIQVIESRAEAQREQIQRRQRELDIRKARFEKAQAIVRVIQETAVGIIRATAALQPQLVPLILGIGAAQLATIFAQPIPRYREGTKGHPGGPAVVGDGGRSEAVVLPDGSLLRTPAQATLVDLPPGAQVFPDFSKMMVQASLAGIKDFPIDKGDIQTAEAVIHMEKALIRAIERKKEVHLSVPGRWKTLMQNGSTYRQYLNSRL